MIEWLIFLAKLNKKTKRTVFFDADKGTGNAVVCHYS